jgi:hypothetical protein
MTMPVKPRLFTRLAPLATLLIVAIWAWPSRADIADLLVLRQNSIVVPGKKVKPLLVEQFTRYDPRYVERRAAFNERLNSIAERIAAAEADGRTLICTRQIYEEVKWLVYYTANAQQIERRFKDLEASFAVKDQSFAAQQSPDDGGWGACFQRPFLRVDATADGLDALHGKGVPPDFAITMAPALQTSVQVAERVVNLIVSDIAKFGINQRGELNSTVTTLVRGNFKPHWQDYLTTQVKMLPRHRNPAGPLELRERLRALFDAWQDPDTGFWGAWYRVDDRLVRTADLSITFHIISYRRGQINFWPQVLKTLRAIRDEPYPYGWLHDGDYVNHNNYDVARILSYGWAYMAPEDRPLFREQLRAMLAWTLSHSLTPEGSFRNVPTFFESLSADYYYGVAFLDVIGFWDPSKRFWTDEEFPNAPEVCQRIRQSVERTGLNDATLIDVRDRLQSICPG